MATNDGSPTFTLDASSPEASFSSSALQSSFERYHNFRREATSSDILNSCQATAGVRLKIINLRTDCVLQKLLQALLRVNSEGKGLIWMDAEWCQHQIVRLGHSKLGCWPLERGRDARMRQGRHLRRTLSFGNLATNLFNTAGGPRTLRNLPPPAWGARCGSRRNDQYDPSRRIHTYGNT